MLFVYKPLTVFLSHIPLHISAIHLEFRWSMTGFICYINFNISTIHWQFLSTMQLHNDLCWDIRFVIMQILWLRLCYSKLSTEREIRSWLRGPTTEWTWSGMACKKFKRISPPKVKLKLMYGSISYYYSVKIMGTKHIGPSIGFRTYFF
jgi:hypothetical protein